MKILIIDNNIDLDCWGSQDLCRMAKLASKATVFVRRAPQGDLPKDPADFDRIVVSGSKTSVLEDAPWVSQLLDFIKKAVDQRKPFLGICYGHQMLSRALGGKDSVRKADTAEFGWTEIQVIEPSPLMKNVPSTFYSFSAHYDEVSQLPKGMRNLAHSEACQVQACQLEQFPIFGIQFHPEKNMTEAKKILVERKLKKDPQVLLNPNRSEDLYDPKLGETLFKNFLEV
jgi:GMP synthase (glutamine-hydrolysing)